MSSTPSLPTGTLLGPYEILALVGEGGMGEVYKARDTRLDRVVAIKVAKADFSERFAHEAKAVAALNHPNICTLHDVGPSYLVMEFVEGGPVVSHVRPRALPMDDVLRYGGEIASALEAAHEKSIVHRDIKPGNIFVTPNGHIKVLDFGLAKMSHTLGGASSEAAATMPMTMPGTAVGTVAYMSPEQARGEAVDPRSDLWSLGVVLYEMATGVRPFQGASQAVVYDQILNRPPLPVRERNPEVPEELARVIDRLLEKDRDLRYQSAAAMRSDLRRLSRDEVSRAAATETAPAKSNRRKQLVAAAAVVAAMVGLFAWRQQTAAAPLTDKDVLVLADFTNTTGDPVFDITLREALAIGLEESPFLKIASSSQVREGLKLSGRDPDERLTNQVARDVCARLGEKAIISGAIATVGSDYVITLEAADCQAGDTLAREQTQARDKEGVLDAVSSAAKRMRAKLGESLTSIQRLSRPDADLVTTTSLDAFQAYARGTELFRGGEYLTAIPQFRRASELDPNFSMAWAYLGVSNRNALNGGPEADGYLQKAFDLIDRTSQAERFQIRYLYSEGLTERDIASVREFIKTYPRTPLPVLWLGMFHRDSGRRDEGLRLILDAHSREPTDGVMAFVLAGTYILLDRLDEAGAIAKQELDRHPENPLIHDVLARLAGILGDRAAEARAFQWFTGRDTEYRGLARQADRAVISGQVRQAVDLRHKAAALASRHNLTDLAGRLKNPDPTVDALHGRCGAGIGASPPPFAMALCGDEAATRRLIAGARNPIATQVLYLTGLSGLRAGKGAEAAVTFQDIVDRKGANWGQYYPLAHMGLARAAVLTGDIALAKKAYQDFLALWKDADGDLPILIAARQEYTGLK